MTFVVLIILSTINDQANIKIYGDPNDRPKTFIRNLKAHFENMRSQFMEAYSETYELILDSVENACPRMVLANF